MAELKDLELYGNMTMTENNLKIYGTNTSDEAIQAIELCNNNNNLTIGYGNYANASGNTNIYGNTVSLYSNNTIPVNRAMLFNNGQALYWKNASGTSRNVLTIDSSNNVLLGYGGYSAGEGITAIEGNDVRICSKAAGANFVPYFRAGDQISITINTAGYVTSSKTKVYFSVQTNVKLLGVSTVTATSNNGFMLRQGNAYTHGCSSSTYVKPDSYSVTKSEGGLNICATFSTTTNVTNNDSIGIYWSGYLTFS